MKVLVSREANKGKRTGRLSDFHHTDEGDLLSIPALVCEGDEDYRVTCGCGRSFSGFKSSKACTVGTVEEMDEAEARKIVHASPTVESWTASDFDAEPIFWEDFMVLCGAIEDRPVGAKIRIHSGENKFEVFAASERAQVLA